MQQNVPASNTINETPSTMDTVDLLDKESSSANASEPATIVSIPIDNGDVILWRSHFFSLFNILIVVPIYCTKQVYRAPLVACIEIFLLVLALTMSEKIRPLHPCERISIHGNLVVFTWLAYGTMPWFSAEHSLVLKGMFVLLHGSIVCVSHLKREYTWSPLVNIFLAILFPIYLAQWLTDIETWILSLLAIIHWQLETHRLSMLNDLPSYNPLRHIQFIYPILRLGFAGGMFYTICLFVWQSLSIHKIYKGELKPNPVQPEAPNTHVAHTSIPVTTEPPKIPNKNVRFAPEIKPIRTSSVKAKAFDVFSRVEASFIGTSKQESEPQEGVTTSKVRLGTKSLKDLYSSDS